MTDLLSTETVPSTQTATAHASGNAATDKFKAERGSSDTSTERAAARGGPRICT